LQAFASNLSTQAGSVEDSAGKDFTFHPAHAAGGERRGRRASAPPDMPSRRMRTVVAITVPNREKVCASAA
jgi:hypothetical protein